MKIGIVAPSRHVGGCKSVFEQGVNRLKESGFEVVLGENLYSVDGNSAGTKSQRFSDLMTVLCEDDIDVVMFALGGDSVNQLLSEIVWSVLSGTKKVIGYSDVTHLLIALDENTEFNVCYGPHVKDLSNLMDESFESLINFVKTGAVDWPSKCTGIKGGIVEGKLYGGNLFVVNNMLSTEYIGYLEGKVLFWEDIDEGLSAVRYQLYQTKLSGVFDRISGMMIGNVVGDNLDNKQLTDLLLEVTDGYDFPILKVDWFGHEASDFRVIPYGQRVCVDGSSGRLSLM